MKNVIYLFVGILLSNSIAKAQFQQWATDYNGSGNGEEVVKGMVVDALGNSYVTGVVFSNSGGKNFGTVKYNTNGIQQWVVEYDGSGNGEDEARGIAIDNNGNLYVTGWVTGTGATHDYATVMYNNAGIQQWAQEYNSGNGNSLDEAIAIAVDANGDVYVTGSAEGLIGTQNYTTIKYNNAGIQQWIMEFDGSAGGYDEAYSMVIDANANIYITGTTLSANSGTFDIGTVKYNTNGVQQWATETDGVQNGEDCGYAIKSDANGNVYVTGYARAMVENQNILTVKYNSAGVQQWATEFNGVANDRDVGYALVLDPAGNVYITGWSRRSFFWDNNQVTIKYNNSGVQQWVTEYDGTDTGQSEDGASAIAIDPAGDIYVTGAVQDIIGVWNYATLKYNNNGAALWVARYNGTGNWLDSAVCIGLDANGNIYVSGMSVGLSGNFDYTTVKYNNTPLSINESPVDNQHHSYPNPFSGSTNITFALKETGLVTLEVFNMIGEKISVLESNAIKNAGTYEYQFSSKISGIYLVKLSIDGITNTWKVERE